MSNRLFLKCMFCAVVADFPGWRFEGGRIYFHGHPRLHPLPRFKGQPVRRGVQAGQGPTRRGYGPILWQPIAARDTLLRAPWVRVIGWLKNSEYPWLTYWICWKEVIGGLSVLKRVLICFKIYWKPLILFNSLCQDLNILIKKAVSSTFTRRSIEYD